MDRTAFDGKGTNYKRIDLSRSFLLRPNDRFIKIAKFFFPFIINSCMYAFFFYFLYNHMKFRDGAQVDRVSYTILQNVATVHLTRSWGKNVELGVTPIALIVSGVFPDFYDCYTTTNRSRSNLDELNSWYWLGRTRLCASPIAAFSPSPFNMTEIRTHRDYIDFNRRI